jgi:hypothetical protein
MPHNKCTKSYLKQKGRREGGREGCQNQAHWCLLPHGDLGSTLDLVAVWVSQTPHKEHPPKKATHCSKTV